MVSKKINIKLKEHFNSKLFINYIKIIASYILKIKNTNNLIYIKKSNNTYELFSNYDNYLTIKILNSNYLIELIIQYNNIEYYYQIENYNFKKISIIQIYKYLQNVLITLADSNILSPFSLYYEINYFNKNVYFIKENNYIDKRYI